MKNCKRILCTLLSALMFSMLLSGTVIRAETAVGGDSSAVPSNYEDYEKWKENYIINSPKSATGNNNMRAYLLPPGDGGSTNFMVSNDAVEFRVSDTGRYTIGTTGGNPNITSDDNKKLLYGHPYPGTSYTTIRLDGVNNIFAPAYTPISSSNDLNNISVEKIGNISISQELKIINNTSTGKADCVEIKYTVKNDDNITHSLGARIMMDTMLGNNDAAPFRIPGIGAVTSELELTGSNIPEYWQAFDSLSNPGVVSQGSFYPGAEFKNEDVDRPDKVQFTNWGRVYDAEWGYTVNPDYSNGDSAVSAIWNEQDIKADDTKVFVTYYGLSDLTQDTKPPLSVDLGGTTNLQFSVKSCTYTPDPFTITSYIGNESSAPAYNVKARLILPEGLELDDSQSQNEEVSFGTIGPNSYNDMASWKVKTDMYEKSEEDRTLTYSVAISGDNIDTKTVSRNIFIPAFKDPNSADDDNEPINNTINGAIELEKTSWWNIAGNTWKDVTSKIHDSEDEDWYYVDVSDTDRYLYVGLELPGSPSDPGRAVKDYDIDLYSFNNGVKKLLAVSKSYYNVDDFRYKIDQPGRYYIRVYSNNGDFDTKLTYTLKTDIKYIFSQYGGEFQGWDYLGTKVDANYEVPIFLGSSVDGVKMNNPDDGKDYYLSDIIKGAVNIWNKADIKGRPTDSDGNYQKIFKFSDSGNKIYLFNKEGDKREDTTATCYCKQSSVFDWFNIGINAEQFTLKAFSAKSNLTNTDALTKSKEVLAHEFGHALGLKDLYICGSEGSSGYAKINNRDKLMLGYWDLQDLSKNVETLNEKDKEGVSLIQGWSKPEDYGYSPDALIASPENKITASASYEYISDTQLYNKSTIIVEGTVQNIANANDENADFPLSMIQFRADKYFKDLTKTNASVLSVYQDGNTFVQFDENTLLQPGDRCILFLTPGSDGSYVMMGGSQARFDILKRNSEDVVISHMDYYIKSELEEQEEDSSAITYIPLPEFENAAADKVLKIPPTITGEALNKANENGWYNTDVTVHFSAEDLLYGLQSVTPDMILSTEGADQSVIGTAVNNRGTSASYTVSGINIDKTIPSIYEAINTRYYLGDKLKLDYTAEDKLSGLQSSGIYFDNQKYDAGSEITLDKPGIHSIKITAEDRAGNMNVITKNINVVIKFNLNITDKKIKLKNLDKKHFALKAFIDIPEDYSVNDVDLSSIMLDNRIKPVYSCTIHNSGSGGPAYNDVLVLFSGPDLTDILAPGENTITITGEIGNIEFEASGAVNCEENRKLGTVTENLI